MRVLETEIPGLFTLECEPHRDSRGFFVETWRSEWGTLVGLESPLVQDNHACSKDAGVVRGLHFQAPPYAQSKLIWVVRGAIYDVAVDIRKGSPTYGKWVSKVLSADNFLRFVIPRGFAHGYMTLEPNTEVYYKVDNYYAAEAEGGIRWDDPDLEIPWPKLPPIVSEKDRELLLLQSFETPFIYRNKQ